MISQLESSVMCLGSQYCVTLLQIIEKDFHQVAIDLWIDSEIAVFWLAPKCELKHFIHNKVDTLNCKIEFSSWGHSPSQDNPHRHCFP